MNLLRRQKSNVYVNAKIKANDILQFIKDKWDQHRLLACIQILMKKGKSEKSLDIMRKVIYNLFKEESERRSKLGGVYYILDGIKRLEHVVQLVPIKKKGRVRYKKIRFLNQQKSISKAVQMLVKHVQHRVTSTQQSYEIVLTKEFKELYTGLSQLYKKNDEVYQEIIMTKYRRRYRKKPSIFLAKFRKVKRIKRSDYQEQVIIGLRRIRKRRLYYKELKKNKYKRRLVKLNVLAVSNLIKKRKCIFLLNNQGKFKNLKIKNNISFILKLWCFFVKKLTSDYNNNIFFFFNIFNKLLKKKVDIIIVIKLLHTNMNKYFFFKNIYYINKQSILINNVFYWLINRYNYYYYKNINVFNIKGNVNKYMFNVKAIFNFYNLIFFKIQKKLITKVLSKPTNFFNKRSVLFSKRRINITIDKDTINLMSFYPRNRRYLKNNLKIILCYKIKKRSYYNEVEYDVLTSRISKCLKEQKSSLNRIKRCY